MHAPFTAPSMLLGRKRMPTLDGTKLSRGLQGIIEKPHRCVPVFSAILEHPSPRDADYADYWVSLTCLCS